jgi:hypothetical protein
MAYLQFVLPWTTVALAAGVAKTVGAVKSAANQPVRILEVLASHDGNTSGNAPDITDFARDTFGTAGTSSSQTPGKKDPGRAETIQTSGTNAYTAESTTITPIWSVNLAQYNGLYHYIVPFAAPLLVAPGGTAAGFCVRQNSPNVVNSSGKIEAEE